MNKKLQDTVNKTLSKSRKNQQVHNPVHILTKYPELGVIVKAWPELPEHIKRAIKALIQTHNAEKK